MTYQQEEIVVGSRAFLAEHGVKVLSSHGHGVSGTSEVHVARGGQVLGSIRIADVLRPEAKHAVAAMREMGLRTVLLSGDTQGVAAAVGGDLGVDEAVGELLPEQKAQWVSELRGKGQKVVMVGDGINDAPALVEANVGIAMGSGTDVARESADVILIGSDLSKFVETLRVARRCRRIIMQNFVGTLAVDSIGVGLAGFGFLNPLLAAFIIVPLGQSSIEWFTLAALLAIVLLTRIGFWYKQHHILHQKRVSRHATPNTTTFSRGKIALSLFVLLALIFSKFFYTAGLQNYYTFYLIDNFGLSIQSAQFYLFSFLASVAIGTVMGGPLGDRFGRKFVLWFSILGALPFTLALPYANLFWTGVLAVVIGLITASAFATILVYAQELIPGRIGLISGLFFGLAFGMAGIGAAALGELADLTSIGEVYKICSFLPLIGLLTFFLPDIESVHAHRKRQQA